MHNKIRKQTNFLDNELNSNDFSIAIKVIRTHIRRALARVPQALIFPNSSKQFICIEIYYSPFKIIFCFVFCSFSFLNNAAHHKSIKMKREKMSLDVIALIE